MVARRRERVADLTRQGWSVKQIQAELGCTEETVRQDRSVTGTTKLRRCQLPTEERIRRVGELTRQGMSLAQIADILKITTRTVIRDRDKAGVKSPPPQHLADEEIATVERLLDDGASLTEAARSIGRRENALHNNKRFRGRGWTKEQVAEHTAACRRMRHCG